MKQYEYTYCFKMELLQSIEPEFSPTSDRDFHCCYPCEIILSYLPISAVGKIKKEQLHIGRMLAARSMRYCYVKMALPCRISMHLGFFLKVFMFFFNIKRGI